MIVYLKKLLVNIHMHQLMYVLLVQCTIIFLNINQTDYETIQIDYIEKLYTTKADHYFQLINKQMNNKQMNQQKQINKKQMEMKKKFINVLSVIPSSNHHHHHLEN